MRLINSVFRSVNSTFFIQMLNHSSAEQDVQNLHSAANTQNRFTGFYKRLNSQAVGSFALFIHADTLTLVYFSVEFGRNILASC